MCVRTYYARVRYVVFFVADPADPYKLTEETRELGLVVCRGTQVSLISPRDGMEEIENPFAAPEG